MSWIELKRNVRTVGSPAGFANLHEKPAVIELGVSAVKDQNLVGILGQTVGVF
jgi:hypothetical protein